MTKSVRLISSAIITLSLLLISAGCRPTATPDRESSDDDAPALSPVPLGQDERLQVVATTSIVADVVQNVGGDLVDLTMLVPLGVDPHAFEPTPQDVAAVAEAQVVFANGAGLEVFLVPLLESAGEDVPLIYVSHGVELVQFEGAHEQEHEEEHAHGHQGDDPHTWFDPRNVIVWTHNIERALSALDPGNATTYAANAEEYAEKLEALDAWIRAQVAQVPEVDRQLVTDHTAFSYFARRYGFEQVGAVFPGYSTLAEPSAQDIADLEDAIRRFDVKAVFVGVTVNPSLAERVAQDTGTQLAFLYVGSLSEARGPAYDYISFMRYNVTVITEALR